MLLKPTWKQRRAHRRIRRRLTTLDNQIWQLDLSDADIMLRHRQESDALQDQHDLFETHELQRLAEVYCIDIPYPQDKPEWWRVVKLGDLTQIESLNLIQASLLSESGQRNVRKLIREEKQRVLKAGVDVSVPVISLLIAVLSLIISVILSLKS